MSSRHNKNDGHKNTERFIMDSGKEPKALPLSKRLLASNGFSEWSAISFSNISLGNISGISTRKLSHPCLVKKLELNKMCHR